MWCPGTDTQNPDAQTLENSCAVLETVAIRNALISQWINRQVA